MPAFRLAPLPRLLASLAALFTLLSSASAAEAPAPGSGPEDETRRVAELHLEHLVAGDYAAMSPTLAEDFVFIDPTADVFPTPGWGDAADGVRGREAALALMRSWELPPLEFERVDSFISGEHAVFWGRVRLLEPAGQTPFPVCFVITVREGRIVERRDYGDYVGLTQRVAADGELEAPEQTLVERARAYWQAYGERRFDRWTELHAPEAIFQDVTLGIFGAASARVVEGSPAIREWFDGALNTESSLEANLEPLHYIFNRHHALVFARFTYRQTGAALRVNLPEMSFDVPIVVALTVRDGHVVEHRDFWDAQAFRDQILAARAAHPL